MPTKTALAPDGTLGARPRIAAHRSGWPSVETPTHADAAHRVGGPKTLYQGRHRPDLAPSWLPVTPALDHVAPDGEQKLAADAENQQSAERDVRSDCPDEQKPDGDEHRPDEEGADCWLAAPAHGGRMPPLGV